MQCVQNIFGCGFHKINPTTKARVIIVQKVIAKKKEKLLARGGSFYSGQGIQANAFPCTVDNPSPSAVHPPISEEEVAEACE